MEKMGSVSRGENRAIFKLQEIGSEFRENNFQTHRFQPDRCESQGGEGECGGGEPRSSSSTGREGKWVSREGCCEGCRGEGCGFLRTRRKRRHPKGVEKKRSQKETSTTLLGANEKRREGREGREGKEDKARMRARMRR
ncbi:hypothetical protein DKX38_025665 [Salix brachista]|uniref:Uncharacterized protein n=1 Tax=Salix brachista TaxID=2182728 RepID=A0A5N5JRI4_9ROSI|nr:hypothetical protein DKX38_025665 [Salix brachista]